MSANLYNPDEATTTSHGRGGAGNIAPDDTEYTDGGIVREGHPAGTYSSGRGGEGNVGHTGHKPDDHDVVPPSAQHEPPHPSEGHGVSTGRGGDGNITTSETEPSVVHQGFADKLKNKLFRTNRSGKGN
ncbi:hypothetical protein DRE_06059 [Drechslerella stenobrocha 248]|uniref:Uncharacterized protein n=1 Tax=Drechslerella stenobrocha 248 TaxID=1043628 RepID=W7HMF2_9PEZI|nr:hypothetical protein DRE_06059 [Drechslerella stenobrocha 248]